MELLTGALSCWKCNWPDLKCAGLFPRNLFLNSLKPQHSNPNPNPLTNQLWCIDFLTPPTPLIIPHRLPAFLESLMPLKNWCSIQARWSKSSLKQSIRFCGIFSNLKQNFIAYYSSKVSSRPDCIFEIHQLWQSGFSRVYSNCCCSCSFEPEVIKIGQSSHNMYSNNIVNFQESTTNINAHYEKSLETYWSHHVFLIKADISRCGDLSNLWIEPRPESIKKMLDPFAFLFKVYPII